MVPGREGKRAVGKYSVEQTNGVNELQDGDIPGSSSGI